MISPAHIAIIRIAIFQRKEFHSVKLRHQLFESLLGNDALYRHPFLLNKLTPFKYNRSVGGDHQFVNRAKSKTLGPFKSDHQIMGDVLRKYGLARITDAPTARGRRQKR